MIDSLIRHRIRYCIGTLIVLLLSASQIAHMAYNGNVNVMFDPDDPYYQRLQALDRTYIESNYLVVLFEPASQDLYSPESLHALQALTDALWQLPFTVRVDSLANYPKLEVAGDNLNVQHLIPNDLPLSHTQVAAIQAYADQTPHIAGRMASPNHNASALFVSVELPDPHLESLLAFNQAAQSLKTELETRYPGSTLHLNGDIAIEHAMLRVTMDDILRVNPMVFAVIFLLLGLFLRSLTAIAATGAVVIASTGIAAGIHVVMGFELNPITMMAPAIIMVLAVADSIHILTVFRILRSQGLTPIAAMQQSLHKNLAPVFWTSVTTAVGFLGMNFGDSPPFRAMGNMAAIGVLFAFVATFTVLPTVALWFPDRYHGKPFTTSQWLIRLSRWVVLRNRFLLMSAMILTLVAALFIPKLHVNDDISDYFDDSLEIHQSIEFARRNTNGVQYILYSLDSGEPQGIYDPDFLKKIDHLSFWLQQQPDVTGVSSYVDTIKTIHQTLHNNDPAYFTVPTNRDLIAQYHLLYELALPANMDLTRDVSHDQSAIKLTVNVKDSDNQALIALESRIDQWLQHQYPDLYTQGTSQLLMFAHMGTNIIHSMIDGSLFTLAFVSIFMIAALRSWKFGLLSIIPNVIPPILVYGIWAIVIGQINHAAAMTFSICLGLVVDDTIHFISKYLAARRNGLPPTDAIEATYLHSGTAIVITSVTLICGVLLLSLSNFTVNDTISLMLAGIIFAALLFDLLVLPSLLLWADRIQLPTFKTTLSKQSANP